MSAHRWVVLAVLLPLLAPASAGAAAKPKIQYRIYRVTAVSGSERVDFGGDPGAGCADHGVCGISGTETFTPDVPGAGAVAFVISSGTTALGSIDLGGTTTASVATAGADAPCTDTIEAADATALLSRGASGWLAELHGTGGLPGLGGADAGVFATHCAGPRVADLAGAKALPRAKLKSSTLKRRTLTLHLVAAGRPFSASGFAGRVTADVRVALRRLSSRPVPGLGTSGVDVAPTPVR